MLSGAISHLWCCYLFAFVPVDLAACDKPKGREYDGQQCCDQKCHKAICFLAAEHKVVKHPAIQVNKIYAGAVFAQNKIDFAIRQGNGNDQPKKTGNGDGQQHSVHGLPGKKGQNKGHNE